jgi:hypothetical protein
MQPSPLEQASALTPAPVRPYGTDTARVIDDYPDFGIFGFPLGVCGARPKREDGTVYGDLMTAMSLDELADLMDACRRRMAGA